MRQVLWFIEKETGSGRGCDSPKATWKCGQNTDSGHWNPSLVIIYFFIQPLIDPTSIHSLSPRAGLGPGDSVLDKMVTTLHLWDLYYILTGAHYASKITIAFDLSSTLKFTKCIHTHYLILNKFTSLSDA